MPSILGNSWIHLDVPAFFVEIALLGIAKPTRAHFSQQSIRIDADIQPLWLEYYTNAPGADLP